MSKVRFAVPLVCFLGCVGLGAKRPLPPPIVVTPAPFHEEQYQDWTVNMSDGLVIASNTNPSGSAVGLMCSNRSCHLFVNFTKACEDGSTYPVMLNTPAGAYQLNLRCVVSKIADGSRYILLADNTVTEEALTAGQIGFALPLASGEFAVSRFSTLGSKAAVNRAKMLAGASRNQQQIGDTTL